MHLREINIRSWNPPFCQFFHRTPTSKAFIVSNADKAGDGLNSNTDECGILLPDKGEEFVVKAGASVDVDFSAAANNPSITVKSNYISYENSEVQSKLDKRNLGQVIVDFFRNIFGLNSVKDVSTKNEQENTTKKSDPSLVSAQQDENLRL